MLIIYVNINSYRNIKQNWLLILMSIDNDLNIVLEFDIFCIFYVWT